MTGSVLRFCPSCAFRYEDETPEVCEHCGEKLPWCGVKERQRKRKREQTAVKRARGVGRKANLNSEQRRAKIAKLRKRDGDKCWLCHVPMDFDSPYLDDPRSATLDHVVPLARQGSNSIKNLKLAHRECNSERGNPDP